MAFGTAVTCTICCPEVSNASGFFLASPALVALPPIGGKG